MPSQNLTGTEQEMYRRAYLDLMRCRSVTDEQI
jgi:hypothetical protein